LAQKFFCCVEIPGRLRLWNDHRFCVACGGADAAGAIRGTGDVTEPGSTPIPDDVVAFLNRHITTVWALDLLLLMRQNRARGWGLDELARELRASSQVITRVIPSLVAAGIVAETEGRFRYAPLQSDMDETIERLEGVYKLLPVTIIRHIALAPHREAQGFADAFKIRKE
jgi:hypothetical protein